MQLRLWETDIYAAPAMGKRHLCSSGYGKQTFMQLRLREKDIYAAPAMGNRHLCSSGYGKQTFMQLRLLETDIYAVPTPAPIQARDSDITCQHFKNELKIKLMLS
jgi:hypothetical protein